MSTAPHTDVKPWPALWALVIGFFMILVDSTIVSIANPAILTDLDTDITMVVWVTSGYLLELKRSWLLRRLDRGPGELWRSLRSSGREAGRGG